MAALSPLITSELMDLLPRSLLAQSESAKYPAGTPLFMAGDQPQWMYFVVCGEVVLERYGLNGQAVCLQRYQSGFVGEASLTSNHYHCDGRTTRETTLTRIPLGGLRKAIQRDSAFSERWILMLGAEVRRLRLQNERLSLPKIKNRLIHLIETEGQQGRYRLSGSLIQLASQLAVTHEALYRTIAQLVKTGQLDRLGDDLVLKPISSIKQTKHNATP